MRARLFLSLAGLSALGLVLYSLFLSRHVPGPAALALLTVVIIAALLARVLDAPIRRAADYAAQLARRGSPPRLPETAGGDSGELFRALNRLAEEQRVGREALGTEKVETDVLLQEMGEGVLALDSNGNVVRANAEMLSVIGSNAPVEGRSAAAIFRNPQLVRFLLAPDSKGGGREAEFDVFGRTMLVTCRSLPSGGVVAVFSDLTQLHRLGRIRSEFVANASHELKTPLTSIMGYAEAMSRPDLPDDERRTFASRVVQNARRMTAIVDDLLTLARLEEPGREIAYDRIAILPLIERAEEEVSERVGAAGITIRHEVDPAGLEVLGDPEGLRQILRNLIDNAVRHAHASVIEIRATSAPSDKVTLTVKDDGTGIPSADLERIFERFYRVDASRSRATGGTGLGLSIVKHWAEAMGSHVEAKSSIGAGTELIVTLPGGAVEADLSREN